MPPMFGLSVVLNLQAFGCFLLLLILSRHIYEAIARQYPKTKGVILAQKYCTSSYFEWFVIGEPCGAVLNEKTNIILDK